MIYLAALLKENLTILINCIVCLGFGPGIQTPNGTGPLLLEGIILIVYVYGMERIIEIILNNSIQNEMFIYTTATSAAPHPFESGILEKTK